MKKDTAPSVEKTAVFRGLGTKACPYSPEEVEFVENYRLSDCVTQIAIQFILANFAETAKKSAANRQLMNLYALAQREEDKRAQS